MNAITQTEPVSANTIETILTQGDLSELKPAQRVEYMTRTCQSLGLNPLTRPFRFLKLNGQVQMYATRDCADQLRASRKISLTVVDKSIDGDLFCVTVRATTPDGRSDEDMGAVTLGPLKGEARANAIMKGITKAKRRVTLSICGLGFLDEVEAETLPHAQTFDADSDLSPPDPKHDSNSLRGFVESPEFNRKKAPEEQPPAEDTWITSVERRIAEAKDNPSRMGVVEKAALEIKTEDDITAMRRSPPIKKLAEVKDNLIRIQAWLGAAKQRISAPKTETPKQFWAEVEDPDSDALLGGPFDNEVEFAQFVVAEVEKREDPKKFIQHHSKVILLASKNSEANAILARLGKA